MMSQTKTHGKTRFRIFILIPIVSSIVLIASGFNSSVEQTTENQKDQKQAERNAIKTELSNNELITITSPDDSKIDASLNLSEISVSNTEETSTEQITLATANDLEIESKHNVPNDTIPPNENSGNELIASVAPTKMNVFYIGVDNPVDIAVTGTQKEKIKVSIDNGTIIDAGNGYLVRVKQVGTATISVKVEEKTVANYQFRVKTVPDPVAAIKGFLNKNELTNDQLISAGGIEIIMQNFDFDLKFEVVSFFLSAVLEGGFVEDSRSEGANFTKQQIELIQRVQSGRKVYIENIKAKGPDGTIRDLGSLALKIK